MPPRLRALWETLRTSLWAVPGLMICAAVISAAIAVNIRIGDENDPVWFLYSGEAEDAPDFLANLLTSMITMTTLAISITMVVLALAAQQLGPRLIRNFMSDLRTQLALGLFISTVIYLLLVLRTAYGTVTTVPNLAVTIGTALVLLSVIGLLLFVHHLARSIIADPIIDRVGADLDNSAARLLSDREDIEMLQPPHFAGAGADIRLDCEGYVQAVDTSSVIRAARDANAIISLDIRAGHHIIAGHVLGQIHPATAITPKLLQALNNSILVGTDRTAVQDLEYSIREMVEVAVRALSPGVNDPYTAIVVLDRLTLSLAHIMRRKPAQTCWCDAEGNLRLIVPASTFGGLTDAAFNMIRQYGQGSAAVLIRLADCLNDLMPFANADQRRELERHLGMVLNAGRHNLQEEQDLKALEARVVGVREKT